MFEAHSWRTRALFQLIVTILVVPFVLPLVAMIQGSLAGEGWGNYKAVLSIPNVSTFFINSAIIAASTIVIVYTFTMMAAFGFSKLRIRSKEVYFWTIIAALILPEVVLLTPLFVTAIKVGLYGTLWAIVIPLVHTDELTVRDRAAAILVIVFGQRIEDVIRLTWDDVTVTDDVVTIRLGKTAFALPSPLDEPVRQLAAAPGHDLTASHPNSNWVFRGHSPGQHIHGASLRQGLKGVFNTRAARLGTLNELTKLGPVPIIADALGYHPSTIERHAIGSASAYAQYIAAVRVA